MLQVIRRARRRLLANELISQAANAFGAALFAFIVLLLVGTEILRWEWLLLLPATAAGIGLYAAVKRIPSPYVAAQIVDHRMGLADTLSTAWFFSRTEFPRASPGALLRQREHADRIAETLDVRRAIPFRMPRSAYTVAVLALLASSLFALRYGITRHLDFHPPLARLVEQQFGFEQKVVLAKNMRRQQPRTGQAEDGGEDMIAPDSNQSGEPEASEGQDAENGGNQAADKKGNGNRTDGRKQSENAAQQSAADAPDESEDQPENASDSRSAANPGQQQRSRQSDQARQSSAQPDANGSGESSSLLTKMKDAFQNLLSRVKPQQSNAGSQQSADQNARQQAKDRQSAGKQQSGKDGQRGNGGQEGEPQDGQSSDRAESSPNPQGNGAGKGDSKQPSKQPGSGIGSQDGDKSIKQAEQLAAMGKISEIIGKRSANLTGEATVEVQSTSQTLRTPYSQRGAEHAQAGAEINRDEIPVALEAYVEKYFEQMRKQAKK